MCVCVCVCVCAWAHACVCKCFGKKKNINGKTNEFGKKLANMKKRQFIPFFKWLVTIKISNKRIIQSKFTIEESYNSWKCHDRKQKCNWKWPIIFTFIRSLFTISCSSSSSSSLCCTISTVISDPLSPHLPIVHCFQQVLKATSHIGTELLYVVSS